MPRRLAASLPLFLLIGTLASIAIAWSMNLAAAARQWVASDTFITIRRSFRQNDDRQYAGVTFGHYEVRRYAGVTLVAVEIARFSPGSLRDFNPIDLKRALDFTQATAIADDPPEAWVPAWLGWPRPAAGPVTAWATAASGWPFRCMVSHRVGPEAQSTVRGALRLDRSIKWPARCLPLLPYWPGLALNAALYGLTLWTVRWTIPALRRWLRLRRGGCPACGYDLRGSTTPGCSECGRGRAPAPA